MKNLIFIIPFIVIYLFAAFIFADINFINWSIADRLITITFSSLLSVYIYVVKIIN